MYNITYLYYNISGCVVCILFIIIILFNGRCCWSRSFASDTVCRSGWSAGPAPRTRPHRRDGDDGDDFGGVRFGYGSRGGRTGLVTWYRSRSRPPPWYCRPGTRPNCRNCPPNGRRCTYLQHPTIIILC